MMEHGIARNPPPVPRLLQILAAVLVLGAALAVVFLRMDAARDATRDAEIFVACQDNYERFRSFGEQARTSSAGGGEEAVKRPPRHLLAEVRRFPVCYEDDDRAMEIVRRVQQGLRTGPLFVPPEPLGVD